nr:wings apart-like protein homolog isoform X2 [Ciona intestinalis]|eukprot:XP_018670035.1 wings apart-like protein homolog isoform X2 [Ciona intestinalis]
MKSMSKRTYSRKRKDTAEAKFDALFSNEPKDDVVTVEVKRVRTGPSTFTDSPSDSKLSKRICKSKTNGSSPMKTELAPFTKTNEVTSGNVKQSFSPNPALIKVNSGVTNSSLNSTVTGSVGQHLLNSTAHSKYDMLFQRNEKSASDKFDALFGDGGSTNKTDQNPKYKAEPTIKDEFDDLFGFETSPSKQNKHSTIPNSQEKAVQLSTQKLQQKSPIKGATMKTVAGHVVLNIHRGSGASPKKTLVQNITQKSKNTSQVSKSTVLTTNSIRCNKTVGKNKDLKRETISPTYDKISITKASYNSRPWIPSSEEICSEKSESLSSSQPSMQSESEEFVPPKLFRSETLPDKIGESIVTSIKCRKEAKAYFTVVKHVKNYQNCLEEGEAQEFEDEVNYLLEGLQSSQPVSVRCLSLTNLAGKCQQPSFRLYLRAHNVPKKIFSYLTDAIQNKCLSLATASLLFMLSRDRRMEIDKPTLQLLLSLLDPLDRESNNAGQETPETNKEKSATKYRFFKSKDKSSQLEEEARNMRSVEQKILTMVKGCSDNLINENVVSVKRLASEALIRFTARQTPEWYREEVRLKGGLDHIISLVKQHVDHVTELSGSAPVSIDASFPQDRPLCMLERLLKVLENTVMHSHRNAMYLVTHLRALLLKKIAQLLQLVQRLLAIHTFDVEKSKTFNSTLYNVMLQAIKLVVNMSNDNEWVSTRVGDQEGMLESIVSAVLSMPRMVNETRRYELVLLSLSLLVNLVESSAKNRLSLMKMTITDSGDNIQTNSRSVVEALVQLFIDREVAARSIEVLGEDAGKKKAIKDKDREVTDGASDTDTIPGSQSSIDQRTTDEEGGRLVETEDGMEWIPSETTDDGSLSLSQRSASSVKRNPEAALSAEDKTVIKKMVDKASVHMEHSIVAAYAALVLGCLIRGNRANSSVIRSHLGEDGSFNPMIRILKKFLSFMTLTGGMSGKEERTLNQIIEDLDDEENRKATVS